MPVVDASVLVGYLTVVDPIDEISGRILGSGEGLWAPHLVDAEVGHALRRGVMSAAVTASAARAALEDLAEMPLQRAPHRGLLERAWSLRTNASFYDALYVALAERLDMRLVTLDARLARLPGARAEIDVIPT